MKVQLVHDLTPPSLFETCQAISQVLASEEIDSQVLLTLVAQRDKQITEHLASLPTAERKQYALKELDVNNDLLQTASQMQVKQKAVLLGLVRGKSAVSQYR